MERETMKLGKLPAREGAVKLKLSDYLDSAALPTPPATFGHQSLVPADGWGMLGNDQYGDCAWAGPAHETMVLNAAAGRTVGFTTDGVLSDYSACTGFNPADPSTDQGSDMQKVAAYRQQTGIIDAAGARHKIGAYVAIQPGDLDQLLHGAYIFGAVGIGIEVYDYFMDQFSKGEPWTLRPGGNIEGGHYVPLIAADPQWFYVVTWGKVQPVDRRVIQKVNDENAVCLSPDQLNDAGKTPEQFDTAQLQADLQALED